MKDKYRKQLQESKELGDNFKKVIQHEEDIRQAVGDFDSKRNSLQQLPHENKKSK